MDDTPKAADHLVDVFYLPYVAALGNLVILFAHAEAELIALIQITRGVCERGAQEVLKAKNAKDQVLAMIQNIVLDDPSSVPRLYETVLKYWADKELRNRYMHDEWYPHITYTGVGVGTRGLPLSKGSKVAWNHPDPDDVWRLALRFRDHGHIFSHAAWFLGRSPDVGTGA